MRGINWSHVHPRMLKCLFRLLSLPLYYERVGCCYIARLSFIMSNGPTFSSVWTVEVIIIHWVGLVVRSPDELIPPTIWCSWGSNKHCWYDKNREIRWQEEPQGRETEVGIAPQKPTSPTNQHTAQQECSPSPPCTGSPPHHLPSTASHTYPTQGVPFLPSILTCILPSSFPLYCQLPNILNLPFSEFLGRWSLFFLYCAFLGVSLLLTPCWNGVTSERGLEWSHFIKITDNPYLAH